MSKIKEFLKEIVSNITGNEAGRDYFSNLEAFDIFSELIVDIAIKENITLTPSQLDEYFNIEGIGGISDETTSNLLMGIKKKKLHSSILITMLMKNIIAKKGQVELDELLKEVIQKGTKRIHNDCKYIFMPTAPIEIEGSSYIINEILKSDLSDKKKKQVLLFYKTYYLGLVSSPKQGKMLERCLKKNNQFINIK